MKTWIALFRGINVGGNKLLPMKQLAGMLEKVGCRDVRTYIQSGNVVFRSPMSNAPRMAARIRAAVMAGRGFEPMVLVLDRSELQRAMAANPFPQAVSNPRSLHLFFLADKPRSPDLESLNAIKANSEAFALKGRIFYVHTPEGLGTSKLAARVEQCLGVKATARNWRTVSTVCELAAEPPR